MRPSGSLNFAVQELKDKASRAWFGISNLIFRNKRMEIDKALGIFDSLVTPVATYGSPFWLPYILPQKSFKTAENLLGSWENMDAEKLNQKICRMVLSVNKKTSRLAVLGEIARYPIFIPMLAQCLSYKLSLMQRKPQSSLLGHVMTEMSEMSNRGQDSWLTRVENIENILKIPRTYGPIKTAGKKLTSVLKSKFDRFWLDKVNESKLGPDSIDHNKLRTYKCYMASFTREPYLDQVRNRNQRSYLTRLRVTSHNLAIERGRHTRPITPIDQRICIYCKPPAPTSRSCTQPSTSQSQTLRTGSPSAQVDSEQHFLISCPIFSVERNCLFGKMSSIEPDFRTLSNEDKFVKLLCPTSPQMAKLSNKLIKIMFESRNKIDLGQPINIFEA